MSWLKTARASSPLEVQSSDSPAVQTKVLRKRASAKERKFLLHSETDREGVLLQIAGGKALVSVVKAREKILGLAKNQERLPLLLREVDAGGVMGTEMEQDEGAVVEIFQLRKWWLRGRNGIRHC